MEDSSDSLSDLFKIRLVQNQSATRQTVSPEATGNLSTAHGQSMNTSPGLESSVVLTKKKSTLKGLKKFSSTNLFDSEPSSVCESFTEIENKRKTKHFRDNSPRLRLSFKDLPECSHVSDGNGEKLILNPQASIVGKKNVDVNFDNTVSSISDSVVGKRGGGFWNTFKKTKNTTANATVDIFNHPEGLSDDCPSSESEESEKDLTNDTCGDESSFCTKSESSTFEEESSSFKEPESTYERASIDEDESSLSCRESESTQKSAPFYEQESIAIEDVSLTQPDYSQFTSQFSSCQSQTQTTDLSISLVHKMCEDKSIVESAGKMLPPKIVPKKRRKALHFAFDSDDKPANDSIQVLPKKPNFPKFHPWCGKQFYSCIIEKMRPKYGLKTNSEAVRLAEYVWQSVNQVTACKDADSNHEKVEEMKRVLARKQIVVTHNQFYFFCLQNLPLTFHRKAVPMGPLFPCRFNLSKVDEPILEAS